MGFSSRTHKLFTIGFMPNWMNVWLWVLRYRHANANASKLCIIKMSFKPNVNELKLHKQKVIQAHEMRTKLRRRANRIKRSVGSQEDKRRQIHGILFEWQVYTKSHTENPPNPQRIFNEDSKCETVQKSDDGTEDNDVNDNEDNERTNDDEKSHRWNLQKKKCVYENQIIDRVTTDGMPLSGWKRDYIQ